MKRATILTAILASALAAQAADGYAYLTIEKQDGTKVSVSASGLTITFADGSLKAGQTSISLTELSRMYFSTTDESTATGIDSLPTATTTNSQKADGIYDLSGRRLGDLSQRSSLRKGIYIFISNGKATKIQVK